jgi:hypothetical protein
VVDLFTLKCRRLGLLALQLVLGIGAFIGGMSVVLVLGSQGLMWLKFGVWQPYPLWEMLIGWGVPPIQTQWLGLQKIIMWALEAPAMMWVALVSFVAFVLCGMVGETVTYLDRTISHEKEMLRVQKKMAKYDETVEEKHGWKR